MTTPWRTTLETALSAHRDDPTARYLQLATIRLDGSPANRSVVHRGFRPDSDNLLITADARSRKVAEMRRSPLAEACWYFSRTREQFRLGGPVRLVDESDTEFASIRVGLWHSLSDAVRIQFSWPAPGADRSDVNEGPGPTIPPEPPPPFVLLMLDVTRADYLCLAGDPPLRQLHEFGPDGWSVRRVNP